MAVFIVNLICCFVTLIFCLKPRLFSRKFLCNFNYYGDAQPANINNKKRKNQKVILKNGKICLNYTIKMQKNNRAEKLTYKKCKIGNIDYNLKFLIKQINNPMGDFATKTLKARFGDVLDIYKILKAQIKKRNYAIMNTKFRAAGNVSRVQSLANFAAFKTIFGFKFNAISAINNEKTRKKLYIKEENAFFALFALSLLGWLVIMIKDLKRCNRYVKQASKTAFKINPKNINLNREKDFLKTYGAYVLNKNAAVACANVAPVVLVESVGRTLLLYTDFENKIKIICNWFRFLIDKKLISK